MEGYISKLERAYELLEEAKEHVSEAIELSNQWEEESEDYLDPHIKEKLRKTKRSLEIGCGLVRSTIYFD